MRFDTLTGKTYPSPVAARVQGKYFSWTFAPSPSNPDWWICKAAIGKFSPGSPVPVQPRTLPDLIEAGATFYFGDPDQSSGEDSRP